MESVSKKRGRAEMRSTKVNRGSSLTLVPERSAKREMAPAEELRAIFSVEDGGDFLEISSTFQPLGVFEFPWQNEMGAFLLEPEGCDLRDVFFSSLVDGCSASISFPGDRISPPWPSLISFPGDADEFYSSDGEPDGVDCIWSCALRQPLSAVYCKTSGA